MHKIIIAQCRPTVCATDGVENKVKKNCEVKVELPIGSDGHDKPFCTKAIKIIDIFKKALGDTDKSQFLKAISITYRR